MEIEQLRNTIYKYTCFFVLSSALPLFAQFDPEAVDAYEPDSVFAIRNAIKYDPVQIIVGDYSLYYERFLAPGWSVEGGAGFTLRNYAAGWNDYSLDNLARNVEISPGYSFSIAVRKYLIKSEELNGWYVAAGYGQRKYNTTYAVVDTAGILTGDEFEDTRLHHTVSAALGYQALGITSNLFLDFFLGPAFRFREFDTVVADDIFDASTFRVVSEKSNQWGIVVGLRFGFGF